MKKSPLVKKFGQVLQNVDTDLPMMLEDAEEKMVALPGGETRVLYVMFDNSDGREKDRIKEVLFYMHSNKILSEYFCFVLHAKDINRWVIAFHKSNL